MKVKPELRYTETMKTRSLKSHTIDTVVSTIGNLILSGGNAFKKDTYFSGTPDESFDPKDGSLEDQVDSIWDLIEDEDQNETYECTLTLDPSLRTWVGDELKKSFGEPTEVRGYHVEGEVKVLDQPVWKFGKKGQGQLWVYPQSDGTVIDVRYYYEKT